MRELFLFDKEYKNLNHGSFGTYPASVRTTLRQLQEAAEARPDTFIRFDVPKGLDEARSAVAKMLNVPRNEVVFVKNATTGVNTVLRNLSFNHGDVVVYFATIYGAVEKTLVSLMETTPVQALKVEYEFPISHDELVRRFLSVVRKAKAEGLNVRVAVFDTIVSLPGVRFPFEKLVEACREEGVMSLIDGAHGIGHIPLDLGSLKPDFFTSNCHKWLYVPRGCAVLYVPRRNQHLIRTTLPTSWGFIPSVDSPETAPSILQNADDDDKDENSKTPFEYLFEYVATNDDTPYLCIQSALKFRTEVCGGDDKIYSYLEKLANEAADIVADALGTDVLQEPDLKPGEASQLRRCGMSTVRLPLAVANGNVEQGKSSPYAPLKPEEVQRTIRWIQGTLAQKYNTFVPVFAHGAWLWTRLSAQVYLERSDFEWLAGVLKQLCKEVGERQTFELPVHSKF